MHITAATAPGSPGAANEDYFLVAPDLVVVLDGATVRTETGCTHGAAWYARTLGLAIAGRATRSVPLTLVLETAIRDVVSRHADTCDLDHPGSPSAGVAVVQQMPDRVRWLVLGDVTVVLDTTEGLLVVSDQRISESATDERAAADRWPIGSAEKAAAMVEMKHVELAARGRTYWVAAADPLAAHHALIGDVSADELHRFAVLTDGAARYSDLFHAGTWRGVLDGLRSAGPEWHIERLVRMIEHHDPLGVWYPRNKRGDDATIVYADLAEPASLVNVTPTAAERARVELRDRLNNSGLYGDGMLIMSQ